VDDPEAATAASADELLEQVHAVRRELELRDESPGGEWVESSARELAAGRTPGWYYPTSVGGGLAFYATRGLDAFGHVHVGSGPGAAERARRLVETLLDHLPREIGTAAIGFTGLAVEEERSVLAALAARPGSTVIERMAMDRPLGPDDGAPVGGPPDGLSLVPIRAVALDALAELDTRAFAQSVDALLVGSDVAHYRHVLTTLLDGQLGLFLDAASTALYRPDPPELVGAILTTERSARRAVFVDFMVAPERQRAGVGRFLLRWGLRALWALGYERVRLWVSAANTPARRLYETSGFRTTATASIYRWSRSAAQPQTSR